MTKDELIARLRSLGEQLNRDVSLTGTKEELALRVAELEEELDDTDETAGQDTPLSRENVLTGHENEVGSAQPDTVILDTSELVTVVALVTLHTDALHATRDEPVASWQEKSLLAHEKETLEYKRQLADLGDKVEHQKRLNELAQQAVRFEEQQSAKQAAISAKARGLTDRQAQRESEAQRLRDVYGDNPAALAKATSALKNTWSAEEQLRGSWMAGLKSGWGEWAESATDSFSQVKSAATQTFDGIAQNMAAMLTGAEADWRGFTRSVLSMMTEILLKQAMVGIVGRIGSAIGGAFGGGASASLGTAIEAAAANFHFATGGFTGTGGKYEPAGIVHRGEFVFTKEATSRIGVGNLYRLMRGYAEGGYVGGAGSPAQMRRAEGINFNQNNHVVIQNDGINGQAGPQLMKAVYDMARKGAQDELRLQLRDGGMLSGSGR